MLKKVFPRLVLVLMLASVPYLAAKAESATTPVNVFSNFEVTTLDGKSCSLYSNYKDKGKIVILEMFATWCPPCKMEIPGFVDLQERYRDKLFIVGLSFDQNGPEIVSQFARDLQINYDLRMGTSELAEAIQLSSIPRTLVLYPDFRIKKDLIGFHTKKEFEDTINRMMAEPQDKKKKPEPKKK